MRLTYLDVNDDEGYNQSGEKVVKVGSILSEEGLFDSIEFVFLNKYEMEKGGHTSF